MIEWILYNLQNPLFFEKGGFDWTQLRVANDFSYTCHDIQYRKTGCMIKIPKPQAMRWYRRRFQTQINKFGRGSCSQISSWNRYLL